MFWRLTNRDFNIRLVDVKNEKYNDLLAGVSFPLSSRAPSVSLVPKTPFPFPFKRLPCRLFFSLKRIIWKLEVRNVFPIFVHITFLCIFRNTSACRNFSSDHWLLSDKFPWQIGEGLTKFLFFTPKKQKQFDKPNIFGRHLHVFPHNRSWR